MAIIQATLSAGPSHESCCTLTVLQEGAGTNRAGLSRATQYSQILARSMDPYRSRQYSHPAFPPLDHPSSVSSGRNPSLQTKGGTRQSPLTHLSSRTYPNPGQGLDRILQSPHGAYGRSSLHDLDAYARGGAKDEGPRYGDGYGSGSSHQGYGGGGQAATDVQNVQGHAMNANTVAGSTTKRGSKACVACGSLR